MKIFVCHARRVIRGFPSEMIIHFSELQRLAEVSSGTQLLACHLQDRCGMVPTGKVLSSFGCHLEIEAVIANSTVIAADSASVRRDACPSCGSVNQSRFPTEAIHFPGLKNVNKPSVWVFPEVLVCLDCGVSEFTVPETELRVLVTGEPGQRKESPLGSSEPHS